MVYYEITYTYDGESMTENGAAYVWLRDEAPSEDGSCGCGCGDPDCGCQDKNCGGSCCGQPCAGHNFILLDSTPALLHNYEAHTTPATCEAGGKTVHICHGCGSGFVTWSHDGTLEGVWDLNGNVWEWCAGLRLVHGELQVIPYNNAADPTCDLSPTFAAWKAIKAAAS